MTAPGDRIGPYRVLERLGAGGMGEVFLALDERLDRRVAIKCIRPERARGSPEPQERERLRREARAAARLNHPAIVQIYDVVTEGEVDWIVLEYVEGRTLRQRLAAGPLEMSEALALARSVASGLAEAHRKGVVHRDLKSENVFLTPSGQAKIGDFGIAKQLQAEEGGRLTRSNVVLGTSRIMAPEQARGEAADHRSDLFSFGVLLYEMVTGVSPFTAENDLATLHRVLQHRQTSAREVHPEVPEELSDLVDHLLEKDPQLRPRSAEDVLRRLEEILPVETAGQTTRVLVSPQHPHTRSGSETFTPTAATRRRLGLTVAALGLLLLAGTAGVWIATRAPVEPLYVAVPQPTLRGTFQGEQPELLSAAVRLALLRTLVALQEVSPKSTEEVDQASGSPAEIAHATAADETLISSLECREETCQVDLQRVREADGGVAWAEAFQVPIDNLFLVASAVGHQARRGYGEYRSRGGEPSLEVREEDFERFLELRRRFYSREEATLEPLLSGLASIRATSPRFLDAYLLEADVASYRFHGSRDSEDLDRAFDLIRQARQLAPEDPRPLLGLFDVARAAGRLEMAEDALEDLERLIPGDVQVIERRAYLLRGRGKPREALDLLRAATRRHPSWRRLSNLALLEQEQGEIEAARGSLEELLERSPGNLRGLSLLAQLELRAGDPQRAAELYAELVRASPGITQLANLGLAQFLLGRYAEAAEAFRRALDLEPRNPFTSLNLADAYLLTGRKQEADELYAQVLTLIDEDPAATGPQFLTVRAQALAHLGRQREAVAAVQEALKLAPDDGSTAYEVSLVYALLGDDASALFNAETALRQGYEPRWFAFPWFDGLRQRTDLDEMLRQSREAPSS